MLKGCSMVACPNLNTLCKLYKPEKLYLFEIGYKGNTLFSIFQIF